MADEQNFKNHGRIVPDYTAVFLMLAAHFVWAVFRLMRGLDADTVLPVLLSATLMVMYFSVRRQVLTVQDRVIRLEMRLRLRNQLPDDLAARAADLHVKQLVALRFAGDDELRQLVQDVVEGVVSDPKDIKKRITDWQSDHLRA